jgi:hypothetical protein
MSGKAPDPRFIQVSQRWNDPEDKSVWVTRAASPVPWGPRLRNLRVEVTPATQGKKIPGRIRAKKVPMPVPHNGDLERVHEQDKWVYHLADAEGLAQPPDVVAAYKEADRQLAAKGEYKGQPFISPRQVAERLNIDQSLVPKYQREGIPWMPRIKLGRCAGEKQKPITHPFKHGYYGQVEDFWLESDADRFAQELKDLPETPPDGKITISKADSDGDISATRARGKIANDEFAGDEVILKFPETVKGKKPFAFTKKVRVLRTTDTNAHRDSGVNDPVPPQCATVNQIADVFKKSDSWVCGLLSRRLPELNGEKPIAVEGSILVKCKKKGRSHSIRTKGYHLLKREWKVIWETMYPDKPWPLDEQHDTPDAARHPAPAPHQTPPSDPSTPPIPATSRGATGADQNGADQTNGNPIPSCNSGFIPEKKLRGPYKAELILRVMNRIKVHQRRGTGITECIEETAAELEMKPSAVKAIYYRSIERNES